jgi:hypothetical protein
VSVLGTSVAGLVDFAQEARLASRAEPDIGIGGLEAAAAGIGRCRAPPLRAGCICSAARGAARSALWVCT